MQPSGLREFYGVFKMQVRLHNDPHNYANALTFWKSVEDKYQERRRRWMEANARMESAKVEALRARRELDSAKQIAIPTGTMAEPEAQESNIEFVDASDLEFSDVDLEFFCDPYTRYYRYYIQTSLW